MVATKCRLKLLREVNPTAPQMDMTDASLRRSREQAFRMRVRFRCSSGPTPMISRKTRRKWLGDRWHRDASSPMEKSSM